MKKIYSIKEKGKGCTIAYHSGYAMLPPEIYLFNIDQINQIIKLGAEYGYIFSKSTIKKRNQSYLEVKDREFDSLFNDIEQEFKAEQKQKHLTNKLLKNKQLLDLWRRSNEVFKIREVLYDLTSNIDLNLINDDRITLMINLLNTISNSACDIWHEKKEEVLSYQKKYHNTSLELSHTEEFKKLIRLKKTKHL